MTTRYLTGITTSGTPHLGNYVGAIRPAIAASRRGEGDAFFFLADYHALVKCDDPARVARSRLEIAATWLACGLDPQRATFYRQSDIPEIPELTWMLTCVTAKGLLNRAHAYKAAVDQNTAKGGDPDAAITAGLYMYPVLMAADILAFNGTHVPVGRDQVQHIEMARDVGQRFNHIYGAAWRAAGGTDEPFVLPEVVIEESVATLPGLDGRKMSKSYDNTVPLFEGGAKATREAIMKIVTDSREPGEPKDPDSSSLYAIYRAFAGDAESRAFRAGLESGMGWGEAKKKLCDRIEQDIAPLRERYDALMAHPDDIEDALREGAKKARAVATPRLETMRRAVGLGALVTSRKHSPLPNPPPQAGEGANRPTKKTGKRARIVSFRDNEGFHFRLIGADGEELLLSRAFADPKAAGQASRALSGDAAVGALKPIDASRFVFLKDGEPLAASAEFAELSARDAAIERTRAALVSLREAPE
ncbi:MAG: Tryptophanyl-tRNA synthetase [Rhodanobacteraceae bacterium]|jgi:tryptophanyl-tRNA synthetase|nr:MAG: Tryptophanyl-tRNA synthetase [Rhodanobacteraceae bacterium]